MVLAQDQAQASQASNIVAEREYQAKLKQYNEDKKKYEEDLKKYEADKKKAEAQAKAQAKAQAEAQAKAQAEAQAKAQAQASAQASWAAARRLDIGDGQHRARALALLEGDRRAAQLQANARAQLAAASRRRAPRGQAYTQATKDMQAKALKTAQGNVTRANQLAAQLKDPATQNLNANQIKNIVAVGSISEQQAKRQRQSSSAAATKNSGLRQAQTVELQRLGGTGELTSGSHGATTVSANIGQTRAPVAINPVTGQPSVAEIAQPWSSEFSTPVAPTRPISPAERFNSIADPNASGFREPTNPNTPQPTIRNHGMNKLTVSPYLTSTKQKPLPTSTPTVKRDVAEQQRKWNLRLQDHTTQTQDTLKAKSTFAELNKPQEIARNTPWVVGDKGFFSESAAVNYIKAESRPKVIQVDSQNMVKPRESQNMVKPDVVLPFTSLDNFAEKSKEKTWTDQFYDEVDRVNTQTVRDIGLAKDQPFRLELEQFGKDIISSGERLQRESVKITKPIHKSITQGIAYAAQDVKTGIDLINYGAKVTGERIDKGMIEIGKAVIPSIVATGDFIEKTSPAVSKSIVEGMGYISQDIKTGAELVNYGAVEINKGINKGVEGISNAVQPALQSSGEFLISVKPALNKSVTEGVGYFMQDVKTGIQIVEKGADITRQVVETGGKQVIDRTVPLVIGGLKAVDATALAVNKSLVDGSKYVVQDLTTGVSLLRKGGEFVTKGAHPIEPVLKNIGKAADATAIAVNKSLVDGSVYVSQDVKAGLQIINYAAVQANNQLEKGSVAFGKDVATAKEKIGIGKGTVFDKAYKSNVASMSMFAHGIVDYKNWNHPAWQKGSDKNWYETERVRDTSPLKEGNVWAVGDRTFADKDSADRYIQQQEDKKPFANKTFLGQNVLEPILDHFDIKAEAAELRSKENPTSDYEAFRNMGWAYTNTLVNSITGIGDYVDKTILPFAYQKVTKAKEGFKQGMKTDPNSPVYAVGYGITSAQEFALNEFTLANKHKGLITEKQYTTLGANFQTAGEESLLRDKTLASIPTLTPSSIRDDYLSGAVTQMQKQTPQQTRGQSLFFIPSLALETYFVAKDAAVGAGRGILKLGKFGLKGSSKVPTEAVLIKTTKPPPPPSYVETHFLMNKPKDKFVTQLDLSPLTQEKRIDLIGVEYKTPIVDKSPKINFDAESFKGATPNFEGKYIPQPVVDKSPKINFDAESFKGATPNFEGKYIPQPVVDKSPKINFDAESFKGATPNFEGKYIPQPVVDKSPKINFNIPILSKFKNTLINLGKGDVTAPRGNYIIVKPVGDFTKKTVRLGEGSAKQEAIEQVFYHGTDPTSAKKIVAEGFDFTKSKTSKGTMFAASSKDIAFGEMGATLKITMKKTAKSLDTNLTDPKLKKSSTGWDKIRETASKSDYDILENMKSPKLLGRDVELLSNKNIKKIELIAQTVSSPASEAVSKPIKPVLSITVRPLDPVKPKTKPQSQKNILIEKAVEQEEIPKLSLFHSYKTNLGKSEKVSLFEKLSKKSVNLDTLKSKPKSKRSVRPTLVSAMRVVQSPKKQQSQRVQNIPKISNIPKEKPKQESKQRPLLVPVLRAAQGSPTPSPVRPKPLATQAPRPITRSKSQAVSTLSPPPRNRLAAIVLPPDGKKKKSSKSKNDKRNDFLGNTRLDNIEGLFRRTEVIHGDRKTARQLSADKRYGKGKTKRKSSGSSKNKWLDEFDIGLADNRSKREIRTAKKKIKKKRRGGKKK